MLSDFFSARVSIHVWVYYMTLFIMCVDIIFRIIEFRKELKKEKEGKLNA